MQSSEKKEYLKNSVKCLFDMEISDDDLNVNLLGDEFPICTADLIILLIKIENDTGYPICKEIQKNKTHHLSLRNILKILDELERL